MVSKPGLGQRVAGVDAAVVELDALADPVRAAAEDRRPWACRCGPTRSRPRRSSRSRASAPRTPPRRCRSSCRRARCRAPRGAARTSARLVARSFRARTRSDRPSRLAVAQLPRATRPRGSRPAKPSSASTIRRTPSRNQGSIRVCAATSSTRHPGEKRPPEVEEPLGRRLLELRQQLLARAAAPRPSSRPSRPISSERIALPSASGNVRPIAIASPTDFIWIVRRVVGARELLEGPARDLDDDVVERGLEGGRRLLRDVVRNLVEVVADREEGRDLGDRKAGRLRGERRRARDARVHLDDDPPAGLRVHGELDVRAARVDADLPDDGLGLVAHGLVLAVRERHLRRDRDRVARVDAHRVEVLDRADDDDVVRGVPHDLELELLPALDRLLDQDLVRRATPARPLLRRSLRNSPSVFATPPPEPAERERGPDRRAGSPISSAIASASASDADALGARDLGADLEHRLLEEVAVLGQPHGALVGADELDVALLEDAPLGEREGEVDGRLAADGRQDRVRPLPVDDPLQEVGRQRLDVGGVGELRVRHDRGRVRVDEDDAVALALERPDGLGARVVELAGLADDDRPRSDDEDRSNVVALAAPGAGV